MLSVTEGEMVELLETSSNEWCLVRPVTRPSAEGWVPTAYLCAYRRGGSGGGAYGQLTPSPHDPSSLSSSDESDTPTEMSEQSAGVLSPVALETCEDEEQRAEAGERRRFVSI